MVSNLGVSQGFFISNTILDLDCNTVFYGLFFFFFGYRQV